ncbi:MAG: hypothetical protein SGJ00_07275 [bacterium]|nr:hypothetical protein [bacterium]
MSIKNKRPNLHYQHAACTEIGPFLFEPMLKLMQENYTDVTKEQFLNDLEKKQYIGLLFDDNHILRGFTTYAINPNNSGGDDYAILFSGDTIISPDYWGTMELVRGWCLTVASIMKTHSAKNWYWFLLSKGHRTFMYLPLFFEAYYPSLEAEPSEQLAQFKLMEEMALQIYPNLYVKGTGILQFATEGGELKQELAQTTFERAGKKHIDWFVKKNPGFYQGDELICIAKIDPNNMKGFAKNFLVRNLKEDEKV